MKRNFILSKALMVVLMIVKEVELLSNIFLFVQKLTSIPVFFR